jgi:hypothetical protein
VRWTAPPEFKEIWLCLSSHSAPSVDFFVQKKKREVDGGNPKKGFEVKARGLGSASTAEVSHIMVGAFLILLLVST